MTITLTMVMAATFVGLFVLTVGYSNRDYTLGLVLMYIGVVMLLALVAYHIHVMVEGGYS